MAGRAFGKHGRCGHTRVGLDCGNVEPDQFTLIANRDDSRATVATHELQMPLFTESTLRNVNAALTVHVDGRYFGKAVMIFFVPVSKTIRMRLSGGCPCVAPDRPPRYPIRRPNETV